MNWHKFKNLLLSCVLISASQACNNSSSETVHNEEIVPPVDESAIIFNQDSLYTFHLIIDQANMEKLDADPVAEEYVPGTLIFKGDTMKKVGVRYKGSIGAWIGVLSNDEIFNPSGYKTGSKISMKVKINREISEQTLHGIRKLQFHALNDDYSYMRDRLGYYLFRESGVPAPRATHARLLINGKYAGLFALVEQVDESFLNHHFADNKGTIFKRTWPVNDQGMARDSAYYMEGVKFSVNSELGCKRMLEFGKALENCVNDSLKQVLEKFLVVPNMIQFIAVDRFIGNDDGPLHWYCGSSCGPHNYYWAYHHSSDKFILIPWDLDHAFENLIENANPVTPIADEWGEISNDCMPFKYESWDFVQKSACCDPIFKGLLAYQALIDEALLDLANGMGSSAEIDTLLDTWAAQIKPAIEEQALAFEDAVRPEAWEAAIVEMKTQLDTSRLRFEAAPEIEIEIE